MSDKDVATMDDKNIPIANEQLMEYATLEEASKSLPPCPPGYEYCWVRYEFSSIKDVENIMKAEEKGWKPVMPIRKFKGLIAAIRKAPSSLESLKSRFETDMNSLFGENVKTEVKFLDE